MRTPEAIIPDFTFERGDDGTMIVVVTMQNNVDRELTHGLDVSITINGTKKTNSTTVSLPRAGIGPSASRCQ